MIHEVIVTSVGADGEVHIAPMGIRRENKQVVIAPFKPSTTLKNLTERRTAVVNYTDDVRVFAGCLTGRYDWPTIKTEHVQGVRLKASLAHEELEVKEIEPDELRPRAFCDVVASKTHGPFTGFNRAQAAVVEGAVLTSRLQMLAPEKIDSEFQYLQIAIDKTAGPRELEAWGWLMAKLNDYRASQN